MKLLLVALLVASSTAQPKTQFDLDCNQPALHPASMITQAHVHFRFDLDANKWCEADCSQVHDIVEVQPTVIWLDKSPDNQPPALLHYRQIDRRTGEYVYASRYVFESATCAKLPFSGFPEFSTKF